MASRYSVRDNHPWRCGGDLASWGFFGEPRGRPRQSPRSALSQPHPRQDIEAEQASGVHCGKCQSLLNCFETVSNMSSKMISLLPQNEVNFEFAILLYDLVKKYRGQQLSPKH